MTSPVVATNADLAEIVEQVWTSYLDPDGLNPLIPAEPASIKSDLHAAVSITGSWHGHVVVACSVGAAKYSAAAFLAMEPEEVGEGDIVDVMGELANIIGGNVKSMLPPGCFVSLPHVINAPGESTHWPSAVMVCELAGTWHDEAMAVSMWQSQQDLKEGTG